MPRINEQQVQKTADLIRLLPDVGSGLNFYSLKTGKAEIIALDMYPPLDHPNAVDFFFFICMHQYGFWHGDENGYGTPLVGSIGGKPTKGSDLLWKAGMRAFDKDPWIFAPENLAFSGPASMEYIFRDDNGPVAFPDLETRLELTRSFGQWFFVEGVTPLEIVAGANDTEKPLYQLLLSLGWIPGYKEDLWEKKALLLAMVLANRPEKFLKVSDPESWEPIVDYHLMRVALRLGLVELDYDERKKNEKRSWVEESEEVAIRSCVYNAVKMLIERSGREMSFIDELMWSARRYCPEMQAPDCPRCVFGEACKRRIELFQPVFRTTAY